MRMPETLTPSSATRYSGWLRTLSAAEAANLDERGIPKKLGRQARKATISGYEKDTHTVTMAVSSETPVDRYYGEEILSHEKGAIRTDRLKAGVALLFNHDMDLHLGRSQSFELDGATLRVTSKFGSNPLALEKEGDVDTGILVDVSIGYIVHQWDISEDTKTGFRTYLAVDWELLEVSLVTVPADPTVGVGRSAEEVPVKVRSFRTIDGAPGSLTKVEDDPATRKATKSKDDDEDDDEDEDPDDEEDEGTGSESERTTKPPKQRTAPMAQETTAGVDLVAQHKERSASLRAIHRSNPTAYTQDDLFKDIDGTDAVSTISERVADKVIAERSKNPVRTLGDEVIGAMSEKEQDAYSLRNVYCAAINQRNAGTFKDKGAEAGLEREVSETLKKSAGERGFRDFGAGIVVPSHLPFSLARSQQQRTIAAGGPVGAVSIVPTIQPGAIELLRARTAFLALGARYMTGMFGTPRMLRQNAAGQSNWLAEQGSSTNTDIGFDFIQMSPKRLSMQNGYFLEFLAQSPIAIEDMLRDDRNAVLARSLDTAAGFGTGTGNSPVGLLGQTGLAAILTGATRSASGAVTAGTGGVPASYVDCNNFEAQISTSNGDIGTMGWALTPRIRAAMRSTPKIPGAASGFIWPDNSMVNALDGTQEGPLGYKAVATSNVAFTGFTANSVNNLHAMFLGVWDQMLIGDWGLNEVINDNITGAPQGLFKVIEHGLYDINFRHIESFAASTSVLPS